MGGELGYEARARRVLHLDARTSFHRVLHLDSRLRVQPSITAGAVVFSLVACATEANRGVKDEFNSAVGGFAGGAWRRETPAAPAKTRSPLSEPAARPLPCCQRARTPVAPSPLLYAAFTYGALKFRAPHAPFVAGLMGALAVVSADAWDRLSPTLEDIQAKQHDPKYTTVPPSSTAFASSAIISTGVTNRLLK